MNTYAVLQFSLVILAATGCITVGWPMLLLPSWIALVFRWINGLRELGEKREVQKATLDSKALSDRLFRAMQEERIGKEEI